jgi:hypothetical protein
VVYFADINLGIISINIQFRAIGLNKIPKGENVESKDK